MTELAVREVLVFAGAVAGAVWGYFLGKLLERQRLAREMRSSLKALERWATQVCEGLDALERSLDISPVGVPEAVRPQAEAAPAPHPAPGPGRAVRPRVSGLRTVPSPPA
jgi:hypothetical protein